MVGIDHDVAAIAYRERFAFTRAAAAQALQKAVQAQGVSGCVLLSTCNRTELWVSGSADPYALLCSLRGLAPDEYRSLSVQRAGREAVTHLLETACGMRSRLFGEDQIISQVGQALELARNSGAADSVLEMLFRTAVTAAKQVKTQVRLAGRGASAASSAVALLRRELGELRGLPCLVIGNGEMGRLTAAGLVAAGCRVTMTLRQYRHGAVSLPPGCSAVPYEQRMECMEGCRAVISATASPHYTVHGEEYRALSPARRVLVDLAVPRDIDPAIARLPGAALYDIDQLECRADERQAAAVGQAQAILAPYLEEFTNWYYFREFVPAIRRITQLAASDLEERLMKPLRRAGLEQERQDALQQAIQRAAEKSVGRLLFGLREHLPRECWQDCIGGLERAAQDARMEGVG